MSIRFNFLHDNRKGACELIQIIDNTLTAFDDCLPSKEELQQFCELLFAIGVDIVELSIDAYERMEQLPMNGKFALHIEYTELLNMYPGFYRYICHHEQNNERVINEIQLNDAREIVKLRALHNCNELRIVGLDDLICKSYDKTMNEIKNCLPKSKINFCPENNYGCASALAVQWILMEGKHITTSFAGYKNNAATEEVIMALRLAIRHKPNRDLSVLPKLAELFEKISGTTVSNKKPVIGKNIFKVESGIHADGIKKNPANYEAYDPKCVGGKSEIVIGKHSGIKAVQFKLQELEIPVPRDIVLEKILSLVKITCTEKKAGLNDKDFEKLAIEVIANEGSKIHS
jgi:homocitrate synthase NifV